MISRPPDPDVVQGAPLDDDLLGRGQIIKRFSLLVSKIPGPLTIALSGSFGSGKTFFLRRCKAVLENTKTPVLLINAWETDFVAEPLTPLISDFTDYIATQLPKEESRAKKLKELAVKIASASLPVALKVLTAGALNLDQLTERSLADAVEKFTEGQFTKYKAAKQSVSALREALIEYANLLQAAEEKKPLVVIIDELDRCRPTYAIEFLETIKHLFSVPGVVFVLGIDRKQLATSASAVFGQALDGDAYLRRFIDFDCSLPRPNIHNYIRFEGPNIVARTTNVPASILSLAILDILGKLCDGAHFSLRKANQFLTRLGCVLSLAKAQYDDELPALLAFLREYDPQLFRSLANRSITYWEVFNRLRKEVYPNFLTDEPQTNPAFLYTMAALGEADRPVSFTEQFCKALYSGNPQMLQHLAHMVQRIGYRERDIRNLFATVDFAVSMISD